MKVAHIRDGPEALEYKAGMYAALSGETSIPHFLWFIEEGDYYVLVHELLGPSLEDLFNYCGRKFSFTTVLLIANQSIRRVKQIHGHGYLHCDIKPDNFLLGLVITVMYFIRLTLAWREISMQLMGRELETTALLEAPHDMPVSTISMDLVSWYLQ